jgi:putative endonuclease
MPRMPWVGTARILRFGTWKTTASRSLSAIGDVLVVCEVKTRRSTAYGTPVEAVTPRKARRLRRLALQWLDEKQMFAPTIRFDVVGIVQPTHGPASIVHVRGID